jgi:hypothetical protein
MLIFSVALIRPTAFAAAEQRRYFIFRPRMFRLISSPDVSSAGLLATYIFLELYEKLRIVLGGGYRFFVLVSRDPGLVKRDQLPVPCLGHDLPLLLPAVGVA